jgi:hypothetical protein
VIGSSPEDGRIDQADVRPCARAYDDFNHRYMYERWAGEGDLERGVAEELHAKAVYLCAQGGAPAVDRLALE